MVIAIWDKDKREDVTNHPHTILGVNRAVAECEFIPRWAPKSD
jgi:hypothetical protein